MLQRFCPLCQKNGVQSEVHAYQCHDSTAVFLCAQEECLWPFGEEECTIFERPKVGTNWEKDWVEKEASYFKDESNSPSLEVSNFSPPLSPVFDTFNEDLSPSILEKPLPSYLFEENGINVVDKVDIDSNVHKVIDCSNIKINTKPKLKSSSPVHFNVQKSTNGYVFKKKESTLNNRKKLENSSLSLNSTNDLALQNKPLIKTNAKFVNNSPVEKIIDKPKQNVTILSVNKNNKIKKKIPIRGFDFDEIKKSMVLKSEIQNNTEKVQLTDKKPVEIDLCNEKEIYPKGCKLIKIETSKKKGRAKIIKEFDFNSLVPKKTLDIVSGNISSQNKKPIIIKVQKSPEKLKNEMDSADFDLDEFLNQQATNLNTSVEELMIDKKNIVQITGSYSIDSDSVLALSNSPRDSGVDVDQELPDLDVPITNMYGDFDYFSTENQSTTSISENLEFKNYENIVAPVISQNEFSEIKTELKLSEF